MEYVTPQQRADAFKKWLDDYIDEDLAVDEGLLERFIEDYGPGYDKGLVLEFGVYRGFSIRRIANAFSFDPDQHIYGFDSFVGLPEPWYDQPAGTFTTGGEMPWVPDNVTLIKGWFEDTLDDFLKENEGPVKLVHIDCDIYSATSYVLTALRERIVPGTVIVFDELAYYPKYEENEYKAFIEFMATNNYSIRLLGRHGQCSMMFMILDQDGNPEILFDVKS